MIDPCPDGNFIIPPKIVIRLFRQRSSHGRWRLLHSEKTAPSETQPITRIVQQWRCPHYLVLLNTKEIILLLASEPDDALSNTAFISSTIRVETSCGFKRATG